MYHYSTTLLKLIGSVCSCPCFSVPHLLIWRNVLVSHLHVLLISSSLSISYIFLLTSSTFYLLVVPGSPSSTHVNLGLLLSFFIQEQWFVKGRKNYPAGGSLEDRLRYVRMKHFKHMRETTGTTSGTTSEKKNLSKTPVKRKELTTLVELTESQGMCLFDHYYFLTFYTCKQICSWFSLF